MKYLNILMVAVGVLVVAVTFTETFLKSHFSPVEPVEVSVLPPPPTSVRQPARAGTAGERAKPAGEAPLGIVGVPTSPSGGGFEGRRPEAPAVPQPLSSPSGVAGSAESIGPEAAPIGSQRTPREQAGSAGPSFTTTQPLPVPQILPDSQTAIEPEPTILPPQDGPTRAPERPASPPPIRSSMRNRQPPR